VARQKMVATSDLTIFRTCSGWKSIAGAEGQMKGRPSREYNVIRQSLEVTMTSVLDFQGSAARIFYFTMTASVFIFISMLLTGILP
jgi:hypothetical protein